MRFNCEKQVMYKYFYFDIAYIREAVAIFGLLSRNIIFYDS